jgi:short-subunit dehydrogenase
VRACGERVGSTSRFPAGAYRGFEYVARMHIVITGASSGLGAAFARDFAKRGHTITLVARRRDLLEQVAAFCGGKCHIAEVDLSQLATCTDFLGDAVRALGPVDALVNNAGMQLVGPTAEADVDAGDRLLDLNVKVPLRLTRAVLPAMLAQRRGVIVDIASLAALAPAPGLTYYNASKAALAAASECLRGELRGTGVHVVTVYPGVIATTDLAKGVLSGLEDSAMLRAFSRGTETRLAELVYDAMVERRARVIYPAGGALARNLPSATRWFLDRFAPKLRPSP